MKCLSMFLVLFFVQSGLLHAAADQASSEITLQLRECIKHGNWEQLNQDKNKLSTIKGEHLEGLLYSLEHHRRAIEVAEGLCDKEVCDHVEQMRNIIAKRFDDECARITAMQLASESSDPSDSETESDSSSDKEEVATKNHRPFLGLDYNNIMEAFILEEREKQEQLWFWQRDFRALEIMEISHNSHVSVHVKHIQSEIKRIQSEANVSATAATRAYIALEQYYTDEAMAMMQAVMNRTWKRVHWEDESGVIGVGYVKRGSNEQCTDPADQAALSGIPCVIF